VRTRQSAKRLAGLALRLTTGNPARTSGRTLLLAYHDMVSDESVGLGDRSLHSLQSRFLQLMDLIEPCCQVAPLMQVLHEDPPSNAQTSSNRSTVLTAVQ
jgi:hypothetical protein